ncbi:uncharacterized protein LOC142325681 [Lycorma delicatula]|uniref:uncharacterized protein LOC142325681 n=1 Tax=Lycorma delicatula TaxID=130591 RepID=UPI003F516239
MTQHSPLPPLLSPPKNIVVPGLIFCFVFTCLSIYCSIHVQFGYHMFCLNLKNNVLDTSNNLYVWDYFLVRCAYSENLSTGGKSLGKDLLYLDIACEYLTRIILPPVEDTSATYKTSKSNDFVKSVKNSIMKQMNVDNTQSGSSKSIRLPIHQESTIDIMHPDGVDKLAESYKLNQNELSGFVKKTIMTQMGFIQLGSVSSSPELEKSAFSISQTESGNTDTTSVKNNKPNENELLNFANSSTERCMIGQRGLIKSGTIESSSQEVNAVNKMQDGFSDNSFIRNIISQIELPQTDSGIFGLSRKEEKAIIITQTESRNSDTTSVNKPN